MRHIAPISRVLFAGSLLAAGLLICTRGVSAQQGAQPLPVGSEVAKQLPAADPSKAATRFAKVVGWPQGTAPQPVDGFTVTVFADKLSSPRWLYVLPNGDVLAAESMGEPDRSPNKVTLLRDADHDGRAEVRTALLDGVRQPFGLLLRGDQLYVGQHERARPVSLPRRRDEDHRAGHEGPRPARRRIQQPLDPEHRRERRRREAVRVGRVRHQRGRGEGGSEGSATRRDPRGEPGRHRHARVRQRPAQPGRVSPCIPRRRRSGPW